MHQVAAAAAAMLHKPKTENKKRKRRSVCSSKMAKQKVIWASLRQVQRECACTNKTLSGVMKAIGPYLGMEQQKSTFVLDQQYSRTSLLLNGCVGCNQHVFLPGDKQLACPRCRHPRLNEATGKPNEVII